MAFFKYNRDTIINEINRLVLNVVVKHDVHARNNEKLEYRKAADKYIAAVFETDSIYSYPDLDDRAFNAVGIAIPADKNIKTLKDKYGYSDDLIMSLIKAQRRLIIDEYVEHNNYYRSLIGQPPFDDNGNIKDTITLTDAECGIAGCPLNSLIHELDDTQLSRLESKGIIDKYISEFPDYKYLPRMGYNRVDLITARQGLNFQIIKVTINESMDEFDQMFLNVYSECREYVMEILYNRNSSRSFDKYEEFMGLVIMIMTVQRVITRQIKMGIQRDFYDLDNIEGMFSTYAIPFIEDMSIDVRRDIMKNIIDLLRHKSTDVVLYDILSLLGFNKIKISELYLLKEHILDSNNKPIFPKKMITPDPNKPDEQIEVLDKEKAYNLTFITVDKLEQNKMLALSNARNRRSYQEVTQNDPDWIEDYALKEYIMNEEFNYVKTKYLDLSVMYRLTKIQFEAMLLFKMILDNKEKLKNVMIDLPKIMEDTKVSIFDSIVIVMALIAKSKGFKGNIFIDPSKIVDILGFNFDLDLFRFRQVIENNPHIPDNVKTRIVDKLPRNEITDADELNKAYTNILALYSYLIDAMNESTTIEEYRALREIYDVLFISKTNTELFKKRDGTIARTFREYLEDVNPVYGHVLDNIDATNVGDFIAHVISALGKLITKNKSLQEYGQSFISIVAGVIELLRRFKSLTTRLIDYSVIYLLDSRLYNMIVLRDDIRILEKKAGMDEYIDLYRDVLADILSIEYNIDKLELTDKFTTGIGLDGRSIIDIRDRLVQYGANLNFSDMLHVLDLLKSINKIFYVIEKLPLEERARIINNFKIVDMIYNEDKLVKHESRYKWVDVLPSYQDVLKEYMVLCHLSDLLSTRDTFYYGIGLDGRSRISLMDSLRIHYGSEVDFIDMITNYEVLKSIDKNSYLLSKFSIEELSCIMSVYRPLEIINLIEKFGKFESKQVYIDNLPVYNDNLSRLNKVITSKYRLQLFDNVKILREKE